MFLVLCGRCEIRYLSLINPGRTKITKWLGLVLGKYIANKNMVIRHKFFTQTPKWSSMADVNIEFIPKLLGSDIKIFR